MTQSEIFGPIAPVIRFSNAAEAIRLANDTPFGPASYFYARDVGCGWRVTNVLEYGIVAPMRGRCPPKSRRGGVKEYLELKYALIGGLSA